MRCRSILLTDL
jgi:hypothetical protein